MSYLSRISPFDKLIDIVLSRLKETVCCDIRWKDIVNDQSCWVSDCCFWSRNGKTYAHAILLFESLNSVIARKRAWTNFVYNFFVLLFNFIKIEVCRNVFDLRFQSGVISIIIESPFIDELLKATSLNSLVSKIIKSSYNLI